MLPTSSSLPSQSGIVLTPNPYPESNPSSLSGALPLCNSDSERLTQMSLLFSKYDITESDLCSFKVFHEQMSPETQALLDQESLALSENCLLGKKTFFGFLESLEGGIHEHPQGLGILKVLKRAVTGVAKSNFNQVEQANQVGQVKKIVTIELPEGDPKELLLYGETLFAGVPTEIVTRILRHQATLTSYCTMYCVSKVFYKMALPVINILQHEESFVFGKRQWEERFGLIGTEPPLPEGFFEKINENYPYDVTDKIAQKCLLVLRIKELNGAPYTFNVLRQIVANPLKGHVMKINVGSLKIATQHGKTRAGEAGWIARGREVIARDKAYDAQIEDIKEHLGWCNGNLIEITTVESLYFNVTGKCLLGKKTYACPEETVVGNRRLAIGASSGSSASLIVRGDYSLDRKDLGVMPLFRFC